MTGQAPVARVDGGNRTARLRLRAGHRLWVSGEDQLFSFADTLGVYVNGNPSGDNGYLDAPAVPAGEIWVITNVLVENEDSDMLSVRTCRLSGGAYYCFHCTTKAITKTDRVCWYGWQWAKEGDVLRSTMIGSAAADTCHMWITGYKMTKES